MSPEAVNLGQVCIVSNYKILNNAASSISVFFADKFIITNQPQV